MQTTTLGGEGEWLWVWGFLSGDGMFWNSAVVVLVTQLGEGTGSCRFAHGEHSGRYTAPRVMSVQPLETSPEAAERLARSQGQSFNSSWVLGALSPQKETEVRGDPREAASLQERVRAGAVP